MIDLFYLCTLDAVVLLWYNLIRHLHLGVSPQGLCESRLEQSPVEDTLGWVFLLLKQIRSVNA